MKLICKIKNKAIFYRNKIYRIHESGFTRRGERKFSHVTYCAVGNAGDTMLSQCVRKEFLFQEKVDSWNIIQITDAVTNQTVKKINETDALVIGGGGLFIGDTNKNPISGWQWPVSAELLKKISCPIIVFSVGFNYFRGQSVSELFISNVQNLVEKSFFVGLRNHGSVEAVKDLLPEDLKDKVVYQPCITTLISKLYGVFHAEYGKRVAYNVAFDRLEKRFGSNKETVLEQIAKSAKLLSDKGYEIIYVAHMVEDFDFLPYLAEEKVPFKKVDLSNALPPRIISFYREVDIVIGMRGHAQMIPFGMNCGIITLASHDKMRWFLEDIDFTGLYIELQDQVESIGARILNCFDKYYREDVFQETIGQLEAAQKRLQEITDSNFESIRLKVKEQKKGGMD